MGNWLKTNADCEEQFYAIKYVEKKMKEIEKKNYKNIFRKLKKNLKK